MIRSFFLSLFIVLFIGEIVSPCIILLTQNHKTCTIVFSPLDTPDPEKNSESKESSEEKDLNEFSEYFYSCIHLLKLKLPDSLNDHGALDIFLSSAFVNIFSPPPEV